MQLLLLCGGQVNRFGIDTYMLGSLNIFEPVKENIPSFGQISKTNKLSTHGIEIYLTVWSNVERQHLE